MHSITQVLDAFLSGKLSREETMSRLHMGRYSELLNALADRGIPPPKPPKEQVQEEVAGVLEILDRVEQENHAA